MNRNLKILQQNLGYTFKNPELLQTALHHSSYINECREDVRNNERLEFLGDAVVNLAIAQLLMEMAPDWREGKLSSLRAALVSEKGLAEVAEQLGLPQILVLGKGEELDGGRKKKSLIADAMEAVFAAVFLDSDYESVREVIRRVFGSRPVEVMDKSHSCDYKTLLQEYLQNKKNPLPAYELIEASGPDHKRNFTMRLHINDFFFDGSGSNKKMAQQDAAQKAFEYFTAAAKNDVQ